METTTPEVAPQPEVPKVVKAAAKSGGRRPRTPAGDSVDRNSGDPMDKLVCITLHDNKEIPPGGQFVGVNGKQFWIKPGQRVVVPRYVVEALKNAVQGVPDVDDRMRVLGVKNVPRLPFTVHDDWDGKVAV